jgi:hypothetical protein
MACGYFGFRKVGEFHLLLSMALIFSSVIIIIGEDGLLNKKANLNEELFFSP